MWSAYVKQRMKNGIWKTMVVNLEKGKDSRDSMSHAVEQKYCSHGNCLQFKDGGKVEIT